MNLAQRPHAIGLAPTQEQGLRITTPLILTSVLGGASNLGTLVSADLEFEQSEGVINNIQAIYVDGSALAFPGRLYFPETQQSIFLNANQQGYRQVAIGQQGQITWQAWSHSGTDAGNATVSIQFLNVPIQGHLWTAIGN